VRFAGAAVDDYGGWAPLRAKARKFDDRAIIFDMPSAVAAVVTLPVA
jgi:hypothetical protein